MKWLLLVPTMPDYHQNNLDKKKPLWKILARLLISVRDVRGTLKANQRSLLPQFSRDVTMIADDQWQGIKDSRAERPLRKQSKFSPFMPLICRCSVMIMMDYKVRLMV
jgi:hypothetical protein